MSQSVTDYSVDRPQCRHPVEADDAGQPCVCPEAEATPLENSGAVAEIDGAWGKMTVLCKLELPCEFARHRLVREVSSGGMGMVYEAEDPRLGRTVAMKVIRSAAFASLEDMARFRAEAAATARLDHPGIVPVYDVGECEGQPYFTMKLMPGGTLAHRLSGGATLPPIEAAAFVAKLARAVHHAHERGVLHRDLKPGNVLLDASGEPMLTDFGLAKQEGFDAGLTITGAYIGTPQYMSPEQAAGRIRDVTAVSDVWALGAVLYQMLAGRVPFDGQGPAEIFRRIAEDDPENLAGIASLPADLTTIVHRCLEKDPARRPPSALFLAEELERFVAGLPVLSRRVTTRERTVRWMRRYPWRVAALVTVFLSIVGVAVGGAVAFWKMREARAAEGRAREEKEASRRSLARAQIALADALIREADGRAAQSVLRGVPEEFREENWDYLNARSDSALARFGDGQNFNAVAADPSRAGVFALSRSDGVVVVADVRAGRTLLEIPTGLKLKPSDRCHMSISPDGAELAIVQRDRSTVLFFDPRDGRKLRQWEAESPPLYVHFRPGRRQVLIVPFLSAPKGKLFAYLLCDADTGGVIWRHEVWPGHPWAWTRGVFHPGGDYVVAGIERGTMRLLDADTGLEIRTLPPASSYTYSTAFSPDGHSVAYVDERGSLTCASLPEGKLEFSIPAEPCGIRFVGFTPDGERLITLASPDNQSFRHARLWDRRSGMLLQNLIINEDITHLRPVGLHPFSGELLVAGNGAMSFETARPAPRWTMQGSFAAPQAAFWNSDDIFISLGTDGDAPVCRQLSTEGPNRRLWSIGGNGNNYSYGFTISPDARLAFICLEPKHVVTLGREGAVVTQLGHFRLAHDATFVCFAPTSDRIWTGRHVIAPETGQIQHPLALSSPGKLLKGLWPATNGVVGLFEDGAQARLILADTNGTTRASVVHPSRIFALVASPDGRLLAEAGADKIVRLRHPATLEVIRKFRAHDAAISTVAFHPTRPLLATASDDLFLRIWDHRTGRMVKEISGPSSVLQHIEWSATGLRLIAASKDRQVRVWEIELPGESDR